MSERPGYKEIIDNLYDGVYFVDRDRIISYWNKGAERITGYRSEDVVGRSCRDGLLNHVTAAGEPLCTGACPLAACMEDGEVREADVFLHHAEGHRLPVLVRCAPLRGDDGTIRGAVETFSAELGVRAAREELSDLRRSVRTDELTGIGNRSYLEGRLRALVAEYEQRPGEAAVAMIDVDRFKDVNDTHGHEVGDRVLRMVATTLRRSLRAGDAVGRWGGEEFVAILDGVHSDDDLRRICDKLRTLVAWSRLDLGPDLDGARGDGRNVGPGGDADPEPGRGRDHRRDHRRDDGAVAVTLSMGATLVREGDTAASVVARADELMYESKRAGRDRVTVA